MPKPARPTAVTTDFQGLITNIDPRDLPSGAAENQKNLVVMVQGELRTRLGLREVTFEEDS